MNFHLGGGNSANMDYMAFGEDKKLSMWVWVTVIVTLWWMGVLWFYSSALQVGMYLTTGDYLRRGLIIMASFLPATYVSVFISYKLYYVLVRRVNKWIVGIVVWLLAPIVYISLCLVSSWLLQYSGITSRVTTMGDAWLAEFWVYLLLFSLPAVAVATLVVIVFQARKV